MTRPSRMLLLVTILAVLAVVVLGVMARRYGSILDRRAKAAQAETEKTLRRVDDFISVRRALRKPGASFQDALEDADLARTEYLHLDRQYREWRTGNPGPAGRMAAVFELRKEELAATEPVAAPAGGPQQ